jgi:hypothetical protein
MTSKTKLTTLAELDGRTTAARSARDTIISIESDLGGADNISTARRAIIENAAVLGAVIEDMGAKWISGEQIDLSLYSTLSNTRRRMLESVGLDFQAKDVTPTLSQYLEAKKHEAK